MTQALVVIGILVAVGVFAYWFKFIRSKKAEWWEEAVNNMVGIGLFKSEWQFTTETTSPQGARVRSVVPVPSGYLQNIDTALQRCIDRFRRAFPNWSLHLRVSDFDIFIIPPRGVSVEHLPGAPLIHVKGVTAAATVLGCDELWEAIKLRPIIVLPHQRDQQWAFSEYFINSIHNEAEHVIGWVNRRLEPTGIFFNFLGPNDVHPWSIDSPTEARGLVAAPALVHQDCKVA